MSAPRRLYLTVQPRLPGVVTGTAPIVATRTGRDYAISLNASLIATLPSVASTHQVFAIDPSDGSLSRVTIASLTPTVAYASQAEAEAGSASDKTISPLRWQNAYDYRAATQAEAEAYTATTKWMSPLRWAQAFTGKLASQAEAEAGTDNAKWLSSLRVKQAITANFANAALTGVPTAPTASPGTNTTQISTTAFVTAAIAAIPGAAGPEVYEPGGRLTLTSATPVTVTDVTAATAIYYTPYKHDKIAIYDGSSFVSRTFTEQTLTLNNPNHAANSAYDVFVFMDSSTLRAGTGPAWSSLTARGTGAGTTELEYVNGRLVNKVSMTVRNGASTYSVAARQGTFVGSFRTTGTAGQTEDSAINRYISNAHNRVHRRGYVADTTSSWTYATASWRESRGAANRVTFFRCLDEDTVLAELQYQHNSGAASSLGLAVSIGLDSTTAPATGASTSYADTAQHNSVSCSYSGLPGLGSHYLASLEYRNGSGTVTIFGTGLFGQSHHLKVDLLA